MAVNASLAVVAILSSSYAIHILRKRQKHLPPGPASYPIVGQLLSAPLSAEHIGYRCLSAELKSDIICLEFMGNTIIVLHSAQSASDLFEKCSAIYSDRTQSTMVAHEELLNWGSNVPLTRYGERFRAYRRIFNTWLNKNASTAFHERQVFNSRQLLARLLKYDGQAISFEELNSELEWLPAASILGATYGYEVTSSDDPLVKKIKQVGENLIKSFLPTHFLVNAIPYLMHVPNWMPGTGWKQTAKEWRELKDSVVEDMYQWTRTQMVKGTAEPSIIRSIVESYASTGGEISGEDEDNVKNAGISFFEGYLSEYSYDRHTFFVAMLLYPETQRKAQEELDQIVGSERFPEMSDLPQLPYLNNLLQELFRWQPVLPLGVPHTCSEDNSYGGYFIPKGAIVIGNVWAMSRDPNVYGNPDPSVPPAPAFGWGRRKCPGVHYAESLLGVTIASILLNFDISCVKDEQGRDQAPSASSADTLVYRPDPFSCLITPRSEQHRHLVSEIPSQIPFAHS
ncbi:O-methylsterigmatocystin oxidoreductase [Ceratobasidium theobromae]|uniref:O-methylsterigmatocystin oxidoreductase n=1 Tax=Ceratobasidium theobromae TaxID=1582974 RepID=A0A5N5QB36_9AGAM|nr:O-methylsterigmatocystin oxidoreductase [Ceratobasidium theobromae]